MDYTLNEPTLIAEADSSDCLEDNVASLLKRRWKIYHSSLFDVDPNKFLDHSLSINRQLNDLFASKKKLRYKVHLTLCPALRRSEIVSETLKVEVVLNGSKVVYTGYFLNWSDKVEERTNLPFVIVDSSANLSRRVHTAIADTLFCTIRNVDLNHSNLVSLFGVLLNFAEKNEEGNARLKYHLPGLPETNSVNVSFRVKDIVVILNFYKSYVQDVEFFYEKVLDHIQKAYSLNLSTAKLAEVSLPDVVVGKEGLISFRRIDIVNPSLLAVQSFLDDKPPPAPALSIPSGSS